MRRFAFLTLLAALLIVGCTEVTIEQSNPLTEINSLPDLTASFANEGETRTFVEDSKYLRWHEADLITAFFGNTLNRQYKFKGKTGDNSGTFSLVPSGELGTGNDLSSIYAVYPYDENTTITDNGVISLSLPATQTYAENSFGKGANTMVAVTESVEDTFLSFKNACGYLKLKLYGDNVTIASIEVKGNNEEKIAGSATATMEFGGVPTIAMNDEATTSVTLDCGEGVAIGATADTATEFWIVLPETTFEGGITITATNTDGAVFSKSTTNTVAITRNDIQPMVALQVEFIDTNIPYITFKADSEQTLSMTKAVETLEFSVNGGEWAELGTNQINFGGDNGCLRLRGKSLIGTATGTSANNYATIIFGNETSVACSGDIRTLIDYENFSTVNYSGKFCFLFSGCTQLITAPELPATSLSPQCYKYMFNGCTNLQSAPILPSTTMKDECYGSMFSGCTNLTTAPELPATKLADRCYYYMFYGCTNLTSPPTLNATTLYDYCYHSMFEGCESLTKAPQLPATNLTEYCYAYMFHGCKALKSAPQLSATVLVEGCYWNMFSNCSLLNNITMLATNINAPYCLSNWVSNISPTGIFTKSGEMTSLASGANGIPNGWKVENWGID